MTPEPGGTHTALAGAVEVFSFSHHTVTLDTKRLIAKVVDSTAKPWFSLRMLHAVDAVDGVDETLAVTRVRVRDATEADATATDSETSAQPLSIPSAPGDPVTTLPAMCPSIAGSSPARIIRVEVTSSRWEQRWAELRCEPDGFVLTGAVRGRGDILQVHAFGGRRPPWGFVPSGSALRSAVSPNPDHPRRIVRDAVEPATISVVGSGAEPGVGRWLFTPAPWCLAVSQAERTGDRLAPEAEWAWLGMMSPVAEQNFTALHYLPGPEGFSLRLDYEGHTSVDGDWLLPRFEIRFGASDPYAAIADYCHAVRRDRAAMVRNGNTGVPGALDAAALDAADICDQRRIDAVAGGACRVGTIAASPTVSHAVSTAPAWWRQPMFCGWGAQRAIAEHAPDGNRHAPDRCTQANYDDFLAALARNGVVPGTIVVDDKWAVHYATCVPNTDRWPDLAGWIRDRHAAGQRVLLWWKAWDPDGAPAETCIRGPGGTPVALDPDSADGAALVTRAVTGMLSADGLDADGLKVDFTGASPSGVALRSTGPRWGAALLHHLLQLAYRAAKAAKPDALVVTHTPNPDFADVTDMVRLNDVMMLDSPDPTVHVPGHMTFRAAIVRAALPEVAIDTDGWCMPDRATWRSYLQVQPSLGVPALYYASRFDQTAEHLTADDYRLVREVWGTYRSSLLH